MSKIAVTAKTTGLLSFHTPPEYRSDLRKHINKTTKGDRVLLTSMTLEPTEPEIRGLLDDVLAALKRGVSVTLAIDAHTFMLGNKGLGPLWTRKTLPRKLKPYYADKLQIIHTIDRESNGLAKIINKPGKRFSLPVAGRSHIKIAIVNDRVYVGGCNLQGSGWIDMMASLEDADSADWLYQTMRSITTGRHARKSLGGVDRGFRISQSTEIFVDSGVRSQSLIFDEALDLIDSAQDWLVMTCQFFPNSITAKHLLRAHNRGVKVEIIFAHPNHHGLIGGMGQHYSLLREKSRLPQELFQHALGRNDPFIHAKLIACDKGLMLGSHNYVKAGVILGTAEIALKSSDPAMAAAAVSTLRRGLQQQGNITTVA